MIILAIDWDQLQDDLEYWWDFILAVTGIILACAILTLPIFWDHIIADILYRSVQLFAWLFLAVWLYNRYTTEESTENAPGDTSE